MLVEQLTIKSTCHKSEKQNKSKKYSDTELHIDLRLNYSEACS